jgi:hypothetical protein
MRKTDLSTQAGIGFTIVVAAATFLVAVVAGLFLIWQPDPATLTQRGQATQISLAAPPDVPRGAKTAHPPAPMGGLVTAPQAVQ